MDKLLKIVLALTAVDKMSAVVRKATDATKNSLKSVKATADKVAWNSFKFGAAIATPLVVATQKAIDFEDAMADVAKVMNFKIGDDKFKQASDDALNLSRYLGKSAEDSAKLMAALAQGGVAESDLKSVSRMAGEISVAFDMAAEEAGDKFIKMRNALGATIPEAKAAVDAMNLLSDGTAAAAGQLLDFMSAGGAGVSNSLKISAVDIEAFGAAIISSGKSGAEAATIMERMKKGLLLDKEIAPMFNKAGGGLKGLLAVLEHGNKQKDPFKFFSNFGEYGSDIQQMAANMHKSGGLIEALDMVGDKAKYADSVTKEFANRMGTTKGKIGQVKAEVGALAIRAGNALLPVLGRLLTAITPMLEKLSAWVQRNPELTTQIVTIAAKVAAASFAISGIAKVVSGATSVISFLSPAIKGIVSGFKLARGVVLAFGGSMAAIPWIAAIVGVIAAVVLIYKNWDKIKAWFAKLWDNVKRIFGAAWDWIKNMFLNYTPLGLVIKHWQVLSRFFGAVWGLVKAIFWAALGIIKRLLLTFTPLGLIYKHWDKISAFFSQVWEGAKAVFASFINYAVGFGVNLFNTVSAPFVRIFNWVMSFGSKFIDAGKNIIDSIVKGITQSIDKVTDKIKEVTQKIRDHFPFSPAKAGPLRDIHKIKLIETIAGTVKGKPLVDAVRKVTVSTASVLGVSPRSAGAPAFAGSFGGGITINFSPQISGGDGGDIMRQLRAQMPQLVTMLRTEMDRQKRREY